MTAPAAAPADGTAGLLAAMRNLLHAGDVDGAERAALAFMRDHPAIPGGFATYARCAGARREWAIALARWSACASRFPDLPSGWRIGLGYALFAMGRYAEAAGEFAASFAETGDAAALAGQALATGRAAPGEAEPLWRQVDALLPEPPDPSWQIARAQALVGSGAAAQAYSVVHAVLDGPLPLPPATYALYSQVLIKSGKRAAAQAELQSGRLRRGGGATDLDRLWLHYQLRDLNGARESFAAAAASADIAQMTALLDPLANIFEQAERDDIWRGFRRRADTMAASDPVAARTLMLRLDIALRDYPAFLDRLERAGVLPEPWATRFAGLAASLRAKPFPDRSAAKVFGIGLGRTSTTSLTEALTKLGYLAAHFSNPFTSAVLSAPDFDILDAAADTPVAYCFEHLYERYPNARFILTERPFDSWANSAANHLTMFFGTSDFAELQRLAESPGSPTLVREKVAIQSALYYRHGDLRAAYDTYHRRVMRFFGDKPDAKLLRHSVFAGDGWAKLCNFLGKPVPVAPYPCLNRRNRTRPETNDLLF